MKTCILPLDSRPCSYNFVKDLAEIGNYEIVLPPMEIMDNFRTPSSFPVLREWLLANAAYCDALIISADQLLYGGLLASRQSNLTLWEALRRLKIIAQLKDAHPNLKIYVSTVLMRTTVSTLSLESKAWWEAVSQYSRYSYLFAQDEYNARLSQIVRDLEEKIPPQVLKEFLSVRERNHAINMLCVDLAARGIVEYLLILQEDCTEAGIHKVEQERLSKTIEAHDLQHKVALHNGTDEAITEMLARAVSQAPLPAQIKWLGHNNDFIALFEDRPFAHNVKSHMQVVNMYEDETAKRILFIYHPKETQGDFCTDEINAPVSGYSAEELASFASEISDAVNQGMEVYLLDVVFANGGDYELLSALSKRISLQQLNGYSAWNTASNALGTILSQMALSKGENNEKNKRFTLSRVLDDVIYQAVVRRRLNNKLIANSLDPYHISNMELADEILQAEWEIAMPLIDGIVDGHPFIFGAEYRWPRTFEISLS